MAQIKQRLGQFFTVNNTYILQGIQPPSPTVRVVEPCAGEGHLIQWLRDTHRHTGTVEAYDIDVKPSVSTTLNCTVVQRDTLSSPPNYRDAWVLSNVPYLARNKCADKQAFDQYNTNDLFKCYMVSFTQGNPVGGAVIIPAAFFLSPRDVDLRVRAAFLSRYRVTRVNYFEERVFPDTSVTVVAFQFTRSNEVLTEQLVPWHRFPGEQRAEFAMRSTEGWIVGGSIYHLPVRNEFLKVGREVTGVPLKTNEQLTRMLLRAMDSGTREGRIALELKQPGFVYPSKGTSRSYAMLTIIGLTRTLTEAEQQSLCTRFNELIEARRAAVWSLFLPQYRESKEYARKRMPFELAYRVVAHLLSQVQDQVNVQTPSPAVRET
jgi:hypothetical protein